MTTPFAITGGTVVALDDAQPVSRPGHTVVVADGAIAWAGPDERLPGEWAGAEPVDAAGRVVTPGLVECHAGLLYAGTARDRPALVEETAATADDDLLALALARAREIVAAGVTTLEVKTGYGVTPDGETRLLRVAGRLAEALPVDVRVTLLAAAGYPAGLDDDEREEFVIGVCDELLPAAAEVGGYDAVEVYCDDEDGLSMEDASTILETVYRRKVPTRVAADRLSDSAGGALAPAFYAKAAIHLDFTDDIAVKAMGTAGTTAVLVPRGDGSGQHPPVRLLREHGVPIAVSGGPGPDGSLPPLRAAALAVRDLGLTHQEALAGVTRHAARALALADGRGTLAVGAPADLAMWPAASVTELVDDPPPRPVRLWARGAEIGGLA